MQGLYIAAAGMAAQQRATEALANDMANLQTSGYKTSRVSFRELMYSREPSGVDRGAGAAATVGGRAWAQGTLLESEQPLDVAIEGPGFFEVRRDDGRAVLTRNGSFRLDARGRLTTADGHAVLPGVSAPPGTDAEGLSIAQDGEVSIAGRVAGRIGVVDVRAPNALLAAGDGAFIVTAGSGPSRPVGAARVHQRRLEASTTDVKQLVGGQRTFQFLARVVESQDQLLATANRIRQ